MKAPEWDWEGRYDCPDCGEEFHFAREDGAPEGWVLQVYHDHTEEPSGVWRAAMYQSWKGRRKPEIVKQVTAQHTAAYKKMIQERQIEKAGS